MRLKWLSRCFSAKKSKKRVSCWSPQIISSASERSVSTTSCRLPSEYYWAGTYSMSSLGTLAGTRTIFMQPSFTDYILTLSIPVSCVRTCHRPFLGEYGMQPPQLLKREAVTVTAGCSLPKQPAPKADLTTACHRCTLRAAL